jgi:hypothetical protein
MRRLSILGVLVFIWACNQGGGGPTAPSGIAELSGSWVGDWTTGDGVVHPVLLVNQGGESFTGTFNLDGVTIAISGSIGSDRFSWTGAVPLCGALRGDGSYAGASPAQIDGSVNLNTLDCPDRRLNQGPIVWRRSS